MYDTLLSAFVNNNNKLTIVVRSGIPVSSYFLPDQDGTVRLNFYFNPDDVRNNNYNATPVLQNSGDSYLVFNDILYQSSDDLSFYAIEDFDNSVVKEYVFSNGVYQGTSVAPTGCPSSIICTETIRMMFGMTFPGGQAPVQLGLSYSVFAPGLSFNGNGTTNGVVLQNTTAVETNIVQEGDCGIITTGQVIVNVNNHTCVFQNGALINDVTASGCSVWTDYYVGNTDCAYLFENCLPKVIGIFDQFKDIISCQDWTRRNIKSACTTNEEIRTLSKVAIGVEKTAGSSQLTVKNGVITDKVKLCKSGNLWCDYVFSEGYELMPLKDVEQYIQTNKHLPNMPSSKEIETAGSFELGDITFRQQEKIEEIFLHLIAMEKEVSDLEAVSSVLEMRYRLNMQ
jgi:hypothetical protein